MQHTFAVLGKSFSDFFTNLFSPDMGEYEYIGVSGSMIRNIIVGLLCGFFLACCMTVFDRRVLGDFVRRVLYCECFSKETAMTLAELGYLKNSIIRGSLRGNVSLRRVVKCVEEEEFRARAEAEYATLVKACEEAGKKPPRRTVPAFKVDPTVMHFYIPEDLKYVADVKFEKKGANWVTLLVSFVLFLVLASLAAFLLPDLLQLIDNMMAQFDPTNNILT